MMMMMMMMMMMVQFQTILAVTGVQDDLKTCAPIKRGEKKRVLAGSQRSSLRGAILARRGSLRRSQRQRYDDISGFCVVINLINLGLLAYRGRFAR